MKKRSAIHSIGRSSRTHSQASLEYTSAKPTDSGQDGTQMTGDDQPANGKQATDGGQHNRMKSNEAFFVGL